MERELIIAIANRDTGSIAKLIADGVNLNSKDDSGRTALMFAVEYNNAAAVDLLIGAMADIDLQNNIGRTALIYAVMANNLELTNKLINYGAKLNTQTVDGFTALMLAVNRNRHMVDALIEAGADLNLQNKSGETTLMLAAKASQAVEVNILLSAGAKTDLQDKEGRTALILALLPALSLGELYYKISEESVDYSDGSGAEYTDSHTIIVLKRIVTSVVSPLINAGANLTIKNNKGATAFAYASSHKEILALLLNKLSSEEDRVAKALEALNSALKQPELFSPGINNLVAFITKQHKDMQEDWDRFMLAAYLGNEDLVTYLSDREEEKAEVLTKEDSNGDNYIVIAAKAGNLVFVEHMLMHEFNVHKANEKLLTNTMHKLSTLADEDGFLTKLIKEMQGVLGAMSESSAVASEIKAPTTGEQNLYSVSKSFTPAADSAVMGGAGGSGTSPDKTRLASSTAGMKK